MADVQRYDGRAQEQVATVPNSHVVQGLYDRGQWPGLRRLVGLLETPFLRPDGTVCQRPGYDPATGYVLLLAEPLPPVPEHPTHDQARQALRLLVDEVFPDFPFVSEAARHVPVANLLTVLARPYLGDGNTPLFAYDATTPGTGKTLAADAVGLIATGRVAPKTPYPADTSELEKLLGATAREAAPLLCFDNINTPFGGGHLDLATTCNGSYKARLLGVSQTAQSTWRTVVMGTGNNLQMKGDTARRTLLCRQESPLERPEVREGFRHPDLLAWVSEHRGELVAAALTLLRAYGAAGQPVPPGVRPVGSFEAWSRLVAGAIVWAGGPNVLETLGAASDDEDPERAAHRVMLALWPDLCAQHSAAALTAKGALEKLYPVRNDREPPPDADGFDDLREAIELVCPAGPAAVEQEPGVQAAGAQGPRARWSLLSTGAGARGHRPMAGRSAHAPLSPNPRDHPPWWGWWT